MRRTIRCLLWLALVASGDAQIACGDCNTDGTVSILDALAVSQHTIGLVPLPPATMLACDVDLDGDADILDALLIAQLAAGILTSLACPPIWVELFPATSPAPRRSSGMAFDATRDVSVLFGGLASGRDDETWLWDGADWTMATPMSAPSSRADHGMAFDTVRQVTVLFGGFIGLGTEDTWEWNGVDWTRRTPVLAPSPRWAHAMVFDSIRNVSVLFGGADDETWEWDGFAWVRRFPAASPEPRFDHAMVFDVTRGVTVLFGGDVGFGVRRDDTWEWDGVDWVCRALPSPRPMARSEHAMAHDAARGFTVLFGGIDPSGSTVLGDTWIYDGTVWRESLAPSSPSARRGHVLGYEPSRANLLLFGGVDGGGVKFGDTWR